MYITPFDPYITPFDLYISEDEQPDLENHVQLLSFDGASGGDLDGINSLLTHGDTVCSKNAQNTSLHLAVVDGDSKLVQLLLERGTTVDAKAEMLMRTPLHLAASNGHNEIVRLLLEHGATVDAKDKTLATPFHLAAGSGQQEVVKLLLEHGAHLNAVDEILNTPLHLASSDGYKEVVQLLIDHGAVVNAKAKDSETALSRAASNGHKEVVKLLLENGATVDVKTRDSEIALHQASANGHKEVVRLLLKHGAIVDAKSQCFGTALHWAAANGHIDVVHLLLQHDANVDAKDEIEGTPLHFAASTGHTKVVQLLLEHGATVNAKSGFLRTPLLLAASKGRKEIVKLLLRHGANVDAKAGFLRTSRLPNADNGSIEVAQTLLDHDAIVDAIVGTKTHDSKIAFHRAASKRHKKVVQIMLEYSTIVGTKTQDLETALNRAAANGHKEVVKMLLENGATVDVRTRDSETALHQSAVRGHKEVVQVLLEHRANIDAKDEGSETALNRAATNGYEEIVKLLLENGATVDARTNDSETALHQSAVRGHKEVVQVLLEHRANIDAKDEGSETALNRAAAIGYNEIVKLLLEHGATVDSRTNDSETALHQAAINGHKKIVGLLLEHGANANAKNIEWKTPLDLAASAGYGEVVQVIVEFAVTIDENPGILRTALQLAAQFGYPEVVKLLLKHDVHFDIKDKELNTLLHLAAGNGRKEVVKLLLEHGVTVDAKTESSETALHQAAANGHEEVVHLLLNHGASVDEKGNLSRTALYKATINGYIKTVSQLLNSGAHVDEKAEDGKTPLAKLSEMGDVLMVKFLLNHGADIEAFDNDGQTPFIIAAKSSHLEVLSLLISRGANMEAADSDSLSALHWSAKDNNLAVLEFLLQSNVNIETTTVHGETALHLAATFSCMEVLTVLLENGSNVDAKNKYGKTPIQSAIQRGNIDIVYQLKAWEATIGRDDDDDMSLLYLAVDAGQIKLVEKALDTIEKTDKRSLHLNATLRRASMQGNIDLVSQLLDMGADIEACDEEGLTPLFLAGHHPELISMLIDRGACIEARNKKVRNLTVLHHYASQSQIEAMCILLNCGCNIHLTDDDDNTVLHYTARNGDCKGLSVLLGRGADINAKNWEGETALHIAIQNDFAILANLLIEYGIDLDAKTYTSESTALHTAINKSNTKLISLLVRQHADVNAKDARGRTALHLAAFFELTEECTLLIKHGANVDSKNVEGCTPLHDAVRNISPEVVDLLLKQGASVNFRYNFLDPIYIAMREAHNINGNYFERRLQAVIKLLTEAGADPKFKPLHNMRAYQLPKLRDTLKKSSIRPLGEEMTSSNLSLPKEEDYTKKMALDDVILKEFKDVSRHRHKSKKSCTNEYQRHSSNTYRKHLTASKAPRYIERSLLQTKHKYGYGFPLSKYLQLDSLPNIDEKGKIRFAQSMKLFNTVSINDRAIAIIQSLLTCFVAKMFISDYFFMLELEGCDDKMPPEWASHFDKMRGVVREQGRMIVQIPSRNTTWSIPGWHEDTHPYIRFIDAIYVCRRSSTCLDEDVFSDVLGESEQKLANDLHAILIAGLSILSIACGNRLVEQLVKAVLDEELDSIPSASSSDKNDDWPVRNRRRCSCDANSIHFPLSPVAAAKAVGIDIWRIRQHEMVTRVWDLNQDILVDNVVAEDVIFVTHRWTGDEITYENVMNRKKSNNLKVSNLSKKLRRIKEALQRHTQYVWIDTICIDKSNLSELDRAIRSMYKWYASCAAVVLDSGTSLKVWCERGWCLQEGAAAGVLFGISEKGKLATIQELANEQHHDLCTLDLHLCYRQGNAAEIIARMDVRKTTYDEDMAYALAGIFSIHLTLAYGEGLNSRERLFHELATKKGDLSFLSFQSTPTMFRNSLPAIGQVNYLVAKCTEASAPIMVSHFGICFDVQLVEVSDNCPIWHKLKGWKDLSFAKDRSMGVDNLLEMAESQNSQSSASLKFAIVHYIRSIMLVEIYDKDLQTGGVGRQIERCHRLQCCQIEEREFTRLFAEDDGNLVRIWLRDKPGDVGASTASSEQLFSHRSKRQRLSY